VAKSRTSYTEDWNGDVDRIAFILDPAGNPRDALKSILVHVSGTEDVVWHGYVVDPDLSSFQYFCYLFVLGSLARHALATGAKLQPSNEGKVLARGGPHDQYGAVVRRYYDRRLPERKKARPTDYYSLPRVLRFGVQNLFPPHNEGGKTRLTTFVGLRPDAKEEDYIFRNADSFSVHVDSSQHICAIKIDPLAQLTSNIKSPEAVELAARIAREEPWKRPKGTGVGSSASRKRERSRSSKSRKNALRDGRQWLRIEAVEALKLQLHFVDADAFIPPTLQISGGAVDLDRRGATNHEAPSPLEPGWRWSPFEPTGLAPPQHAYLLSSVSGAGKTTLLRHLQTEILKAPEYLPFYIDAQRLGPAATVSPADLTSALLAPLKGRIPIADAQACLEQARKKGRFILFVDAIENLPTSDRGMAESVRELMVAARGAGLVLAGRPSAVQRIPESPDVPLLRLAPFDEADRRCFFGAQYDEAVSLCANAPELLSVPMYAYIMRRLIQAGKDRRIRSRHDLYSAFLHHVLSQHPPNRRWSESPGWNRRVLESLGCASYAAIDQQPPEWGTISSRTLSRIPEDLREQIEASSTAGLTELLHVRDDPEGPALVFVHPSFQEVLAARWAAADTDRTDHVLSSYWDPKWREIILFLAGEERVPVVERIYPRKAKRQDPLHTRLFLAAECGGQASLPNALERRLVKDLLSLVSIPMWRDAVLTGLVDLNTDSSREQTWTLLTSERIPLLPTLSVDVIDLEPLFSAARLKWLLAAMKNREDVSDTVSSVALAWSRHIPPTATARLHQQDSIETPEQLHRASVLWVCFDGTARNRELSRVLAISDVAERTQRIASLNFALHAGGMQLGPKDVSCFLSHISAKRRLDWVSLRHVVRMLDASHSIMRSEHFARLRRIWKTCGSDVRSLLASWAPSACAAIGKEFIDELLELAYRSGAAAPPHGWDAVWALRHYRKHIRDDHISAFLAKAESEGPSAFLVGVGSAIVRPSDMGVADWILQGLWSEDTTLRRAALTRAPDLQLFLAAEHSEVLMHIVRRATRKAKACQERNERAFDWEFERSCAIKTLACVPDLVSDKAIKYIVRTAIREHGPTVSMRAFADRIGETELGALVKRICKEPKWEMLESWCKLVPAAKVAEKDAEQLLARFRKGPHWAMRPVLELLRAIESCGRLQGGKAGQTDGP